MQQRQLFDVPWQYAVYVRPTTRDRFSFSHIKHTTVNKSFPKSLRVSDLKIHENIVQENERVFKSATVLVLVTGDKAHHISYRSFADNTKNTVNYDHMERLTITEDDRHKPTFSDLNRGYMALTYHCTLAHYECGPLHQWNLANVVPMLSDIVVLPRILTLKGVKPIMCAYCRAIKKGFKESLLLAEASTFREVSMLPVLKHVHTTEHS